jgi:hypothetical protein
MRKTILIKVLVLALSSLVTCQVSTNFTEGTNVPDACVCATAGNCALAGGELEKITFWMCFLIILCLITRW